MCERVRKRGENSVHSVCLLVQVTVTAKLVLHILMFLPVYYVKIGTQS